jgi:hypothetical protein
MPARPSRFVAGALATVCAVSLLATSHDVGAQSAKSAALRRTLGLSELVALEREWYSGAPLAPPTNR